MYSVTRRMPFCPIDSSPFHDTHTFAPLLCLAILTTATFLFSSVATVYPDLGSAILLKKHLLSSSCVSLVPTKGSATYWPHRWSADSATPPPVNHNTALWSLELCLGAAHAHASYLDPLPGEKVSFPHILGGRGGYCSGDDTCTGILRVTRLHGCPRSGVCGALSPLGCEPLPPLAPGTPASIVRDAQLLGPDELLMALEGGEFHTPYGTHLGNCSYVFPFSVTIPGAYRVILFGVHADWDALDETTPNFPPLTLDNIAGDDLFITLGSVSAGAAVREAVLQQHNNNPALGASSELLPVCSDPMASQGRWVTNGSTEIGTLPPPRVQVHPPWGPGIPYQHTIASGVPLDMAFLPFSCRWPLPGSQTQGCFENRSLHFRGDSQVRTFFNHFMVSVVGMSLGPAVKGVEGSTCVDSIRFRDEPRMEKDFISCYSVDAMGWDGPLSLWSGNPLEPHPYAVVLNFGQHWAAEHRVSAAAYEGFLREYFSSPALHEQVRARGESFMGFVWIETPPLNILNHGHVHAHKDGRTMHRVHLYNAAARRALRVGSSLPSTNVSSGDTKDWVGGKGVHYIPTFDIIFPVLDASEDHAHQSGVAASLDPIAQAMRAVMCSSASD